MSWQVSTLAGQQGPVPSSYAYFWAQGTSVADGNSSVATFLYPCGLAASSDGAFLYVADSYSNLIRAVNLATGVVDTVAGTRSASFADGTGTAASFAAPTDVAISRDDEVLFVSDLGNHRVRSINIATRAVRTVAGSADGAFGWTPIVYFNGTDNSCKNPVGGGMAPCRDIDGTGTDATFQRESLWSE